MKRISEMDENIDYGYLRQVFQGNHPVVSYEFVKKICDCLEVDVVTVYSGVVSYS